MQKTPRNSLLWGTDTHTVDTEKCPPYLKDRSLTLSDRHLVVFDDVSYSGRQMRSALDSLQRNVKKVFGEEKISLYITIPFISSVALETIQNLCRVPSIHQSLKVHLITTDHKPIAMNDVFSREEIGSLIAIEDLETKKGQGEKVYKERGIANKCLTITEWKVPDSQSIPSTIQKFFVGEEYLSFVTEFKPPYKA